MPRGIEQRAQKILDRVNPRVEPGLVMGVIIAVILARPATSDDLPSLVFFKLLACFVVMGWVILTFRTRTTTTSRKHSVFLLVMVAIIAPIGASLMWLENPQPTPWLHELARFTFMGLAALAANLIVMPLLALLPKREPSTPPSTTSFTLSKTPAHTFRLTREA